MPTLPVRARSRCRAASCFLTGGIPVLLFAVLAPALSASEPVYYPPDPVNSPAYTLPDPLTAADGSKVTTAAEWMRIRRPEILEVFRSQVYGRVPPTPYTETFKVVHEDRTALAGAATRKDVDIMIGARGKSLVIRLVLYTPNGAPGPVPAFLLMGNETLQHYDPMVVGANGYWPVARGLARGYAMAAFWSWDVDPDLASDTAFKDGIHAVLDAAPRTGDSWATLAAWAWGMSRCLDYLVTNPAIASNQVAVIGHSRAGKTALWAAAQDQRFAMACSNDSGCGGAALSRHRAPGKERVEAINRVFPHWFDGNFKAYNGREDELPVDQHMLLALIAPRPLCVASASNDPWADPRGEFLSAVAVRPVYALFGRQALGPTPRMPAIGQDLHGDGVHYHIRAGKHGLTLDDWQFYFDSADQAFHHSAP